MALGRRGNGQPEVNIWPGFVDAMTALLLVLFFVLSIFMIVQFVLSETITGQDQELTDLAEQVAGLADALGLEQNQNRALESELNGALSSAAQRENQQIALIASLTNQRNATAARIASFEERVASLIANNRNLNAAVVAAEEASAELETSRTTLAALEAANALEISAKEAAQLALAQVRDEIDTQEEEARLAAARADALRAMIADLEGNSSNRVSQISDMQAQIASATQALFLAQVSQRETQQQITALNSENRELAIALESSRGSTVSDREDMATVIAELGRITNEKTALQGRLAIVERERTSALRQLATLQGDADGFEEQIIRNAAELAEQHISLEEAQANADQLAELVEDRENAIVAAELALAERAAELSDTERARVAEAAAAEEARAELAAIREATRVLQEDLNIAQMARIAVLQELSSTRENASGTTTKLALTQAQLEAREQAIREAEEELAAADLALAAQQELLITAEQDADAMAAELSAKDVQITASQLALAEVAVTADSAAAQVAAAEARIVEQEAAMTEAQRNTDRLAELLSDREIAITAAELALAEHAAALSDAEKAQLADAAAAAALRSRLEGAETELTAMTLALEEERRHAMETLTQLAAARAAARELAEAGDQNLTINERQQIALAEAQRLLRQEEAVSANNQRQIALLNQQTAALRSELNQLQALLNISADRDAEAQIQIDSLGSELNTALARVAAEQRSVADAERARADAETARADAEARERELLEAEATVLRNFRSEFFGRMRAVLGGRDGVQIVGDRFVFSSEVLFAIGSADLGAGGKAQIGQVAAVLRDISDEIPPEINWILRVDGHTDRTQLSAGGRFADNWELSQARALSVVKYMIEFEGIPANRLAATGFGEFQPLNDGNSPEDLSANRRIELKFTEQ